MTDSRSPKFTLNPFPSASTTRVRWIPKLSNSLRPTFAKLAKDLRLVDRAREAGHQNLPDKDDRDLDEAQRQIIAETQTGANFLKQFLASQLSAMREKIHGRSPRRMQVELLRAEANAAVADAKLNHGAALEELRLIERRKLRDLRKFRTDHRLNRDAAYADHWMLPIAILMLLIVGESAANGFIFKEAVTGGMIQGFVYAGLFGTVNVLLGSITGYFGLRLLGHVRYMLKSLGALFTVSGIALGFVWNLLVAHYRETLERDLAGSEPQFSAFLSPDLLTTPETWFALSTLEAWALLLLGLTVFAICVLKGHGGRAGFDDPYPGYRAVDLVYREAEEAYSEARSKYARSVREAYATVLQKLHDRHAADSEQLDEIAEIADQAEERATEVRDSVGEWRDMGMTLLRAYRDDNRAIRTAPAPDYFDTYPSFEELATNLADAADLRREADRAADIHAANASVLAQIEEELALARTRETESFLDEIAAIETRAERRLAADWDTNGESAATPRLIKDNRNEERIRA